MRVWAHTRYRYREPLRKHHDLRVALWQELIQLAESMEPAEFAAVDPIPTVEVLKRAIGWPPPKLPERAEQSPQFEHVAADLMAVYRRVHVQVMPGLRAYGLLITPRGKGPFPLFVIHSGGGGYPELILFHQGNYHDQAIGAVQRGYAVLLPNYTYYPYFDRDAGTPIPRLVREELDEAFRRRGTCLLAVELMRQQYLLDAVLARPDVDSTRVCGSGLSYGGFFAMYSAALDPRIRAVALSCAFRAHSVQDPNKPKAYITMATSMELAAMICPRPLL
ncbi:MAG TPA: hypothetical protein VFQ91_11200, partial [Bryobacteraceae bacterium]|nr:hypothetical protein [Bryobacteraceae bacterium]